MALDFPTSPTVGQQYGGYTFDGTKWKVTTTSTAPASIGPTPPASATNGDMWWNSTDGTQFMYYNDGSSAQWVESRSAIAANGYYSPNYLINGAFDFWQRGAGPFTSNAYMADRFSKYSDTTTNKSYSQASFTPGECPVPQSAAKYYIRYSETVASTGNNIFEQIIENVDTLAGQTVTFSWYAKASTARQVDARFGQYFGSGGSANEYTPRVTYTLSTSWARYSHTLTIPSIAGKTVGPNSGLSAMLYISNNQVGTVDIWGLQVEAGSVATTFRRNGNSITEELAACQRYYQTWGTGMTGVFLSSTYSELAGVFPVKMRATPTMTSTGTGYLFNLGRAAATVSMSIASTPNATSTGAQLPINHGSVGGTTPGVAASASDWLTLSAEL